MSATNVVGGQARPGGSLQTECMAEFQDLFAGLDAEASAGPDGLAAWLAEASLWDRHRHVSLKSVAKTCTQKSLDAGSSSLNNDLEH